MAVAVTLLARLPLPLVVRAEMPLGTQLTAVARRVVLTVVTHGVLGVRPGNLGRNHWVVVAGAGQHAVAVVCDRLTLVCVVQTVLPARDTGAAIFSVADITWLAVFTVAPRRVVATLCAVPRALDGSDVAVAVAELGDRRISCHFLHNFYFMQNCIICHRFA